MTTPSGVAVPTPPKGSPAPVVASFSKDDISIAVRAADSFTKLYYTAYDSPTRLNELPKFYRATSSISWNGNQKQGVDGLKELITNMPPTEHELKSFDCHPIPGTSPPSLLLTVSGSVTHGRGISANPPSAPPRSIEGHPRVFSQTFMLLPDPESSSKSVGEVAKYFISADAFRFVG